NVTTCEFNTLADGAACPLALSDCSPGNPGAGACQSGLCTTALCPCDGETAYQALTKECASGAVYDSVTTTCTCDTLGADAPGGGQCAQFGPQVVAGCEMPGQVLSAQLAFDTLVFFQVTSPGAGGPGTVDHEARLYLDNPFFNVAGGLEIVEAVTVTIASDPPGNPPTLVNELDPALAGQLLGVFTGGTRPLDFNLQILDETTSFEPAAGADTTFALADFEFVFSLAASGDTFVVNTSGCTFDNPGTVLEPGAPPADGSPISCQVPNPL
ncbi:MAG: hypothetical protein AAGF92_23610, partial [Myxococcota bacterium]